MSEPRIDLSDWTENRKRLIAIPAIICVAIVCSLFKNCTTLGETAKSDTYDPNQCGAGFVTKADSVLELLLQKVDTSHYAVSLDALNARYQALDFALPYSEEDSIYIEASDIRLVGIHPEYIDDENLRNFYYNSRLPQLLRQQAEHPGETYFSIRSRGMTEREYGRRKDGKRPIVIESIKMIRPMFKVALEKNPWTGVIESTENCLFASDSTIYFTYGNSVIPLHRDRRYANRGGDPRIQVQAIMNEGVLLWKPDDQTIVRPVPINYYNYYLRAFEDNATPHAIALRMQSNRSFGSEVSHMTFNYSNDSLWISHYDDLYVCDKNHSMTDWGLEKKNAGDSITIIPIEDGMKLIVYHMNTKAKLCEFTIYKHNPAVQLSRLTQSSTGVSRYYISENLTDLFTQQLLRGLSRHLSNRENIDTVRLSVDPLLSREFEQDVNDYLHQMRDKIQRDPDRPSAQVKNQYDMSLTIMDMATGEVLATPFYTTLFDNPDYPYQLRLTTRNAALMRRSIGSTFKPMVALASVLSVPSLLDLNTTGQGYGGMPDFKANRVRFLGHTTQAWGKGSQSHWNGCNFSHFLGHSDDVYPVALAALALSGRSASSTTRTLATHMDETSYFSSAGELLRFKNPDLGEAMRPLEEQCFTQNMRCLFHLPINETRTNPHDRRMTDIDLFGSLMEHFPDSLKEDDKCYGLQEVAPDQTQLRMDRFKKGEDFRGLLVSWILGQGDNMWNCIKLAEAWSRMISKRDIRASFIHDPKNAEAPSILSFTDTENRIMSYAHDQNYNSVWNDFLDKFHEAQSLRASSGYTLYPMADAVHAIDPHIMLFSKTGTPNSYTRYDLPNLGGNKRYMDVAMYTFALVEDSVFQNRIRNNRPSKGIVCVVRLTRSYECTRCRANNYTEMCDSCQGYSGLWSMDARNFFSRNPSRLRKLMDMTRTYIYDGHAPTTAETRRIVPSTTPASRPRAATSTTRATTSGSKKTSSGSKNKRSTRNTKAKRR